MSNGVYEGILASFSRLSKPFVGVVMTLQLATVMTGFSTPARAQSTTDSGQCSTQPTSTLVYAEGDTLYLGEDAAHIERDGCLSRIAPESELDAMNMDPSTGMSTAAIVQFEAPAGAAVLVTEGPYLVDVIEVDAVGRFSYEIDASVILGFEVTDDPQSMPTRPIIKIKGPNPDPD